METGFNTESHRQQEAAAPTHSCTGAGGVPSPGGLGGLSASNVQIMTHTRNLTKKADARLVRSCSKQNEISPRALYSISAVWAESKDQNVPRLHSATTQKHVFFGDCKHMS